MPSIATLDGRVILKDGKPSCECCSWELVIWYDWEGTGQADLDTRTEFLSETVGWSCGEGENYLHWVTSDNIEVDGFERVNVDVDRARDDSQWTSSVNIELYAGWYGPAGGSGNAYVKAKYNGESQLIAIEPGSQGGCASTHVATITVFDDGTFDLF